ncbi:preprotein translocase subunit SecG, partial [Francisella tularensis subsp. holarctica]|nr:preprotein translocase subunit SecG [Francisella tularensis subsp. holarctica]
VSCLTLGSLGKSSAITANISIANTDSSSASQYDPYQKEVSQAGTADTSIQASK